VDHNRKSNDKPSRREAFKYVLLSLLLSAAMTGCSAMQGVSTALGLAGGSAPSVEATAQVGKENTAEGDAVVSNRRVDERRVEVEVGDNGVSNVQDTESGVSSKDWSAESITVDNMMQNVPPLFLFLFALGWILPGPVEVLKGKGKSLIFLRNLITGKI